MSNVGGSDHIEVDYNSPKMNILNFNVGYIYGLPWPRFALSRVLTVYNVCSQSSKWLPQIRIDDLN